MMERTALGSRSNCAAQAWPGQATGAALPNRSSRRKSQARSHSPNTVIGHCTHPDPTKHPTRSSLLATSDPRPRSGRQSIPIGHALGNGLVQPIFRPPSRRSPSDCSPSVFRRDAGLKMLCIMLSSRPELLLFSEAEEGPFTIGTPFLPDCPHRGRQFLDAVRSLSHR